ncbi:hypothetical protein Ssi03_48040 [Sphaerisporangium siamense]|nr:hypothetical protein Ssi03_48040 [Sphaerisporangium siamense]
MCQVGGHRLVLPEAVDALISQTADKPLVNPLRPAHMTRLTCGNVFHMGDTLPACGHREQACEDRAWSP